MRELVRSVWAEPRAPDPPGRVWRDRALVGGLVPLVLLEGLLRPEVPARAAAVFVALALVPTLWWRRSRPLLMVAIAFTTTGVTPLLIGHEPDLATMVYLLLLPYALVRWGSGREAAAGAALILAEIGLSVALGQLSPADAVLGTVVMVAVFALATAFRYRAGLWARGLDQAKLRERERLARDLHDTVAHHVSAMAIRAQAGIAVAQTRPEAAVDALRVIEAEATRALAEMRTMVHTLRRSHSVDLAPSPGIPDLVGLADRSPPGPVVDVELLGDLDDVPSTVGTAIYRLAQESVTNARRHARHATRIEVRVAADAGAVRLRVSDDGDTRSARPAGPGGFGIVGMTERAGLLGGTCEAGPDPDRGWTVAVALPRTGTAG
ncbi:sensor histidine kinase [Micromonospora rosaria]|uniref:sensor histidine kinase n=1 Tax=Micromonospora rosaria TaxID=47874 RepID=UPI0012FB5EE8|nr:histidine kinase [Micromonospora rosaria]